MNHISLVYFPFNFPESSGANFQPTTKTVRKYSHNDAMKELEVGGISKYMTKGEQIPVTGSTVRHRRGCVVVVSYVPKSCSYFKFTYHYLRSSWLWCHYSNSRFVDQQ